MSILLELSDGKRRNFKLPTNTSFVIMIPVPDENGVYTLTMEGFDGSGNDVIYSNFGVEEVDEQFYIAWETGIVTAPARHTPYVGVLKSESKIYGEKVYDKMKIYVKEEGENCGHTGENAGVAATVVINNGSATVQNITATDGQTSFALSTSPTTISVEQDRVPLIPGVDFTHVPGANSFTVSNAASLGSILVVTKYP